MTAPDPIFDDFTPDPGPQENRAWVCEALNRIAQTTEFQGRRLLDGSLDFITTAGTGFTTVADLQIDRNRRLEALGLLYPKPDEEAVSNNGIGPVAALPRDAAPGRRPPASDWHSPCSSPPPPESP